MEFLVFEKQYYQVHVQRLGQRKKKKKKLQNTNQLIVLNHSAALQIRGTLIGEPPKRMQLSPPPTPSTESELEIKHGLCAAQIHGLHSASPENIEGHPVCASDLLLMVGFLLLAVAGGSTHCTGACSLLDILWLTLIFTSFTRDAARGFPFVVLL